MSGVNDFFGGVVENFRESANGRIDEAFDDGYNQAAHICTGVMSEKIDGLLNQIQSGQYLSEQEQFLLSSLNEMKSRTEAALRGFYNTADGE